MHEAAERLGMHRHTAYRSVRKGRAARIMAARGRQRIWLVRMSAGELERIKTLPAPDRNMNPAWEAAWKCCRAGLR